MLINRNLIDQIFTGNFQQKFKSKKVSKFLVEVQEQEIE